MGNGSDVKAIEKSNIEEQIQVRHSPDETGQGDVVTEIKVDLWLHKTMWRKECVAGTKVLWPVTPAEPQPNTPT